MRAPSSMDERWEALKAQEGGDGVRIQKIHCDDGEIRYAVYINGTGGANNGNLTLEDNVPAFFGADSITEKYIRDYMRMHIPEGSEVMIHGYSQGGIHAQNIALDSPYKVTDVVTYGSPYVTGLQSRDGQNIIRVADLNDGIPRIGEFEERLNRTGSAVLDVGGKIVDAWRAILGDRDGAVESELRRMERGTDLSVTSIVGDVNWDLWLGSHTDPRTYLYASRQAEVIASTTRDGRRALRSMERYNGTVIYDTDHDLHGDRPAGVSRTLVGVVGKGFSGADVEQLLKMARQIELRAQSFNAIVASSTAALMLAEWTGADIDQIRSAWNRQSKPAMQRTAANLASLAIELRKQAEQQRVASGQR